MINVKFLAVVTPPFIYHGCSTRKTFWEESFTGEEKLLSNVNMKFFGRSNIGGKKEIKSSDKYVTLNISLEFYNLDEMKIISSESKLK